MKTLTLISSIILLLAVSCKKEPNPQTKEIEETKKLLFGEWYFPDYLHAVNECDTCAKVIFQENDSMLFMLPDKHVFIFYKVTAKDSIEVIRPFEEVDNSFRNTTHKISFIGVDTIHIQGFVRAPNGVRDVEFVRNKN